MKKIIVAIDGHSSCGKSTMAKSLAAKVGYIYVDTGAMYRAVTLFAMRQGLFDAQRQPDAARLEALVPKIEVSFRLGVTYAKYHMACNSLIFNAGYAF